MKITWWQDGIHVRPDNDEERQAMAALFLALDAGNGVQVASGKYGNAPAEVGSRRGTGADSAQPII